MCIVQSVLFNKDDFTLEKALEYLVDNNYKYDKIDYTQTMIRFKQENTKDLLKKGYNEYQIKKLNNGVELVLAFKKENSIIKLYL
jgi:hypothetical protein